LTYPERFGGCASLSGTLDIADATRQRPLDEWRGIFGFDLESAAQLKGTEHDLFHLIKRVTTDGKPLPRMYFWCGEGDHNVTHNRRYQDCLQALSVDHLYEESEGDHSWKWWDLHIQDALRYLLA
jgi:S-formylglutathione hydrolase FrmB